MAFQCARRAALAVLVVSLLAAGAGRAQAQVITTYTTRAAWDTAAGPSVTINFEGIAPAGTIQQFPAGLTLSGVTFLGSDASFSAFSRFLGVADGATVGTSVWNSGSMLTGASLGTSVGGTAVTTPGSVTLPPGVTAVGFNYGTTVCAVTGACNLIAPPWTVRLSTGQVLTLPTENAPPNMAFWGVVSNTVISSIQINPSATFMLVDNFSYAPPVAVPAMPAWAFVALTLLLMVTAVTSIQRRSAGRDFKR